MLFLFVDGFLFYKCLVVLVRVECVCVNVASTVGCGLSRFYLCAFQMYPMCVVGPEFDSTSAGFVRRPSQAVDSAQKRNWVPISGEGSSTYDLLNVLDKST